MEQVTISIVTYNGVGKIESCLKALHAQTFTDYRVIVVDNASGDGTIAAVTNLAPEAKIIALHENVGFGAGHNVSIRESSAPYVLILNQDVILHPKALEKLVEAAHQSHAAAVGPLLLRPGSEQNPVVDTAGQQRRLWWAVHDRGSSKSITPVLRRSGFVWGISGACMLLERNHLELISFVGSHGKREYFDEMFFMYKEDVDVSARLRRQGYKSWYEAEALGTHGRTGFAAPSLAAQAGHRSCLPAYVREYSYRNHWFVILKHAWLWQWPFVLPYELLKFLFIAVTSPRTLRVIPDIIRNAPRMVLRRYV